MTAQRTTDPGTTSVRRLAATTIAVGVFMMGFEVVRNWGDWQPWPFWVIDYICGVLLVGVGVRALRAPVRSLGWLCGVWGFLLALVTSSFLGNVYHFKDPNWGPIRQEIYTALMGFFLLCVVVGFLWCMSVAGRRLRAVE